ncbi:kinase family protein [Thalictrum thalictroides]|uniref:Kinase family protein n=1 Tax=Thalictrum thalictroides TaxID=46969 RepID=A0A7J6VM12_THATH|nr:kinase family protein [Thalictrum thalictroides]
MHSQIPRIDVVERNCSNLIVRNSSAYTMNYYKAIQQIQEGIINGNFGTASAGDPPSKMYVMAQCHGDLSNWDCRICFEAGKSIIPSCLPHIGGRVYLDGCFIRAANYSFFHEIITPDDTLICGSTKYKSGTADITTKLIQKLIKEAPSNDGYKTGKDTKEDGEVIYALANCWKTLDKLSCSTCLEKAASSIFSCLPSTDGYALTAGCIIQYSDYNFLGINQAEIQHLNLYVCLIIFVNLIIVGTLVITFCVCVGKFIINCRNKRQRNVKISGDAESDLSIFKMSLRFKYSTIEKATNHFNESNKLGQGGFGEVFKGCLGDGREIAVKRLFVSSTTQTQDVVNEVNIISLAEHRNLVRFLGCSLTYKDSLLVYEFVPNMSLDRLLFDPEKKKELDWQKRLGIIIGTARGLKYLHTDYKISIVHRDIKASNILLDLKYRPKISDFGLAKFYASEKIPSHETAKIAGTLGYMAPEYLGNGQLTEKVDVYSYGVLVLEILSGVRNNKFGSDDSLSTLVTSTWKHFQSYTMSEIIDRSLEIDNIEEILRVAQVGLLCTQEAALLRPTMAEIIQMLTQKNSPLSQPSKPPFVDECMELSHYSNSFREQTDSCSSTVDLNQR